MADVTTYVGLDVHQASIAVARLTGLSRTAESWGSPMTVPPYAVWRGNCGVRPRVRSNAATKPGRAGMRCNGR
jgi:hypothetical protein